VSSPTPSNPNPRSNSGATSNSASGCRSTTWASTRHQEQPGHGDLSDSKTVAATATTAASDTVVLRNNWIQRIWALISDQMTVENTLPMAGLEPGKYKVTIKVNDGISKQEIAQSAPFVVE